MISKCIMRPLVLVSALRALYASEEEEQEQEVEQDQEEDGGSVKTVSDASVGCRLSLLTRTRGKYRMRSYCLRVSFVT